MANSIWKRVHRGLITVGDARTFLDVLLRIPVEVRPATAILAPALEIASAHDRSIYDALFVALAHQSRLKGVTADEALFNAVHNDFPEIVLLRNW